MVYGMARSILLLTAFIMVALSGCFGGDDDGGDGTSTTGPSGGTTSPGGTSPSPSATGEPATEDRSCDVAAGSGFISVGSPAGNLGGCDLGVIEKRMKYLSGDVPDGCHIEVDTNDDGTADAVAEEGSTHEAGTDFIAFCDAGVTDVTVTVTLQDA